MKNQKLYLTLGAVGVLLIAVVAVVALQGKGGNLSGYLGRVTNNSPIKQNLPVAPTTASIDSAYVLPKLAPSVSPGSIVTVLNSDVKYNPDGKKINIINFRVTAGTNSLNFTPPNNYNLLPANPIWWNNNNKYSFKNCILSDSDHTWTEVTGYPTPTFSISANIPAKSSHEFNLYCDVIGAKAGDKVQAAFFAAYPDGWNATKPYKILDTSGVNTTGSASFPDSSHGPLFIVP